MEMMNKEVALVDEKKESDALAEYAGFAGEDDTHDAQPIASPILRWRHMGTGTSDIEGGKFWNTLEGKDVAYDEIPCVFLDGKNSRAYYATAYDPKNPKTGQDALPDCRSADGITGVGDPGGECKTCPHAQWHENGSPPSCALSYDRLLWDFHTKQPSIMSFARSKIKAIKNFQQAVKARNGGVVPMWGYKAVIRSEKKDAYWVPVIEIEGLMPREDAMFFKNLKTETNAAFMRATGEEVPVVTSSSDEDDDDAASDAAKAY